MGDIPLNSKYLMEGGVPIVMMVKVPRDTMNFETFANIRKVFPYTYINCPCGPPDILEATWTLKEINNPYSTTCNAICDLIDFRSSTVRKNMTFL